MDKDTTRRNGSVEAAYLKRAEEARKRKERILREQEAKGCKV